MYIELVPKGTTCLKTLYLSGQKLSRLKCILGFTAGMSIPGNIQIICKIHLCSPRCISVFNDNLFVESYPYMVHFHVMTSPMIAIGLKVSVVARCHSCTIDTQSPQRSAQHPLVRQTGHESIFLLNINGSIFRTNIHFHVHVDLTFHY